MKKKIKIFWIVGSIILFLVFSFILFNLKQKSIDLLTDVGEKIYCNSEQRNVDVCITLYDPVCGFDKNSNQIKTYSNSCFACMDENVLFYIGDECK